MAAVCAENTRLRTLFENMRSASCDLAGDDLRPVLSRLLCLHQCVIATCDEALDQPT